MCVCVCGNGQTNGADHVPWSETRTTYSKRQKTGFYVIHRVHFLGPKVLCSKLIPGFLVRTLDKWPGRKD